MVLSEVVDAVQMKRARVEHYLEELVRAEFLSEKHVPTVGKTYRAIARGRKHLMQQGLL